MTLQLSLTDIEKLAAHAAESGTCGTKNQSECVMRILRGIELGLSPGMALNAFHNLKGNLTLKSDLYVGVCLGKPVCAKFEVVESTDEVCTYVAQRVGGAEQTVTFTKAMAQAAKLWGSTGPWRDHPRAMLRARCAATIARQVFPDVVGGLYSDEEGEEIAAKRGPRARMAPGGGEGPVKQLPAAPPAPVVHEGEFEDAPAHPTVEQAVKRVFEVKTPRGLDDLRVELRPAAGSWSAEGRKTVGDAFNARVQELLDDAAAAGG